MALPLFQGISFINPKGSNLCYCNSAINCILASNTIVSNISQYHCAYCSFLYLKLNDPSSDQSSIQLKNWIAQKNPQFRSRRQQDPSEFLNCLIIECHKLTQLTRSEIISTYRCNNCKNISDNADSEDRFQNIVHLNITGDSMAEIIFNARTNTSIDWRRCHSCGVLNNHTKKQNWFASNLHIPRI